jgi:hypothetical protein
MKYILLIICCLLGFNASAQWYRIDKVLKKHERYPLIEQAPVAPNSIARIKIKPALKLVKIHAVKLDLSEYNYQAVESMVMRTAQHNMRFRVYNDASYNFTELAHLYIKQNRYSEAKWYLLQSNIISRQENDDKHTIANLIDLATIKSELGDYIQAQADLTEAHDMANSRGYRDDALAIEKKMQYIKLNKNNSPKTDVRYAEAPSTTSKAE